MAMKAVIFAVFLTLMGIVNAIKLMSFSSNTGLLRVFTFLFIYLTCFLKPGVDIKIYYFLKSLRVVIMKFFSFFNVIDYIIRFPNIELSLTFLDESYLVKKIV